MSKIYRVIRVIEEIYQVVASTKKEALDKAIDPSQVRIIKETAYAED